MSTQKSKDKMKTAAEKEKTEPSKFLLHGGNVYLFLLYHYTA